MIKEHGRIQTAEVAKALGVTHETVRKDILALEKRNLLTRTHGGAVGAEQGKMVELKNLKMRLEDFPELKKEAAESAVEFIGEGDVIALDAGTTAIYIAELIAKRFNELTVVTQCLSTFSRLNGVKNIRLILTGGEYFAEENALTGHLAVDTLSKIHVMKSFVFPAAISVDGGLNSMHREFVETQQALIKMADEVFVVGDSSKFEKYAMYKVWEAEPTFTYITDSRIQEETVLRYKNEGFKLVGGKRK